MPIYTVRDKETGEEETLFVSYSSLQEYLGNNPTKEHIIVSAPALLDPMRLGRKKTDSRHRDKMKAIKENHRGSTVRTGNLSAV